MKKKLIRIIAGITVIIIVAFSLSSCVCNHIFESKVTREPTCSNGERTYYCTKCGYRYTESIPAITEHKYKEKVLIEPTKTTRGKKVYTCEICYDIYYEDIDKICWELKYWKDDFGDVTDNAVAFAHLSGTFSNSVQSGSDITVFVYADKGEANQIKFEIYEYGRYPVSFSNSASFKVKDSKGNLYNFSCILKNGCIILSNEIQLIYLMRSGGDLKCVLTVNESYVPSIYNFNIDANGFAEIYSKTK